MNRCLDGWVTSVAILVALLVSGCAGMTKGDTEEAAVLIAGASFVVAVLLAALAVFSRDSERTERASVAAAAFLVLCILALA